MHDPVEKKNDKTKVRTVNPLIVANEFEQSIKTTENN